MYKKDEFKKLDAKYNTHLYTGLIGFAMSYCHRHLEKFNKKEKYSKVLEIGAGSAPHLDYLKHDYDEYFVVETEYTSEDEFANARDAAHSTWNQAMQNGPPQTGEEWGAVLGAAMEAGNQANNPNNN